jgi:flagellar biosynthesis/type III secretory pathway protein FliH
MARKKKRKGHAKGRRRGRALRRRFGHFAGVPVTMDVHGQLVLSPQKLESVIEHAVEQAVEEIVPEVIEQAVEESVPEAVAEAVEEGSGYEGDDYYGGY